MTSQLDILVARESRGLDPTPDEVAEALLAEITRLLPLVRSSDPDETAQAVLARLHRRWSEGRSSLSELGPIITTALHNEAIDQHRRVQRRRETSLSTPVADGDGELGHLLPSLKADPADQVQLMEELRTVVEIGRAQLSAFEKYLASADPITRRMVELAGAGLTRQATVDVMVAEGLDVSCHAVRQRISRIMKRFPVLREHLARRAANGSATRIPADGKVEFREALASAGPAVQLIHALRRLDEDWAMIAGALQQRHGMRCSSQDARLLWDAFLADLSPAARRRAP